MPRNLNSRFQQDIARARRIRIIGGSLLATCLLVGTGAALTQTQLPHQVATTLKPIGIELGNSLSQLPSALSQRIPNFDPQLPTAQLAASATSFPQSVADRVRNFFAQMRKRTRRNLTNSEQPPHANSTSSAAEAVPANDNDPAQAANDNAPQASTTVASSTAQ